MRWEAWIAGLCFPRVADVVYYRLVQAVLHLDDLPARLDQHTLAGRQEESSASPPT
ncbi:hypothetical protein [Streptomyces sp. NPDC048473]|uniref:hypothetical protein n=1 Tax=unclassified Streptomyces TaxID=2593676 RepID=UPI00371016CD